MTEILTIGHSNHDIDSFLSILKKQAIQVLVDIRSDPYSRYAPQFNKSNFQRQVEAAGIEYRYSGSCLGGRPKDTLLYAPSGKPDYEKLAATDGFRHELEAVAELAKKKRVALMCSEADPSSCHRESLIARVLKSWGYTVIHIMPDGIAMGSDYNE